MANKDCFAYRSRRCGVLTERICNRRKCPFYAPIIKMLGGERIDISAASNNHINALEMVKDYGDGDNPINVKAQFIMSLYEQIVGAGRVKAQERSIIDRAVAKIYEEYMIDYTGEPPTLVDFHNTLKTFSEPEARDIALAMELFTEGSLNAFAHIIIPDSVISIDDTIFMNCTNLRTVKIGNSVTSIGGDIFKGCISLTSIRIPDSVVSIDTYFEDCINLMNIDVGENNENYSSIDGVWFNKDKTELLKYPAGKLQTEYTVPDSVIHIRGKAFYGCSNLVSVTIPDGVTTVPWSVFYNCENLSSINLPESVTSIGSSICYNTEFYNNEENWKDGVLYIGNYLIEASQNISGECIVRDGTRCIADAAFWCCNDLESIIIPDSIRNIGSSSIWRCDELEKVIIKGGLQTIGSQNFWVCKNLKKIFFPDSITDWGYMLCQLCENLTDVYYGGTETQWNEQCIDVYDYRNPTMFHFNATGIESPKISNIDITPNSNNTGKNAEIQLDTVEYDSTLITLFCNDNISVNNKIMDISAGDTSKTVEIPDNADNVKVFIWDSLEGMRPLCEAKTKTIE